MAGESIDVPKRLALPKGPENRYGTTDKDAKLVNWYLSTVDGEEGKEVWYYKRPGLSQASQPSGGAAAGAGVFNWLGDIYAIFGNKLYKNNVAVAGTVNTAGGIYKFASCLGATPKLQLGNGVKAYNYDSGAGLVQIIDPDFPAAFEKGWAYLDGTTYVLTPTAHIQGDDFNDPPNWNPLNDILAQIEPDQGKALAKQLVYIIAMKQWSTEAFYDAGNAVGSPLGAVQGAKQNYGCVMGESVQSIDSILLWVCTSQTAGTQVAKMDNLRLEIKSTPPVERILQTADWTTTYSWQLSLDGHRFYGITSVVSNFTLVYDLDEDSWAQWTDSSGNYFPIIDSTYDNNQRAIFQHATNGKLYYVSANYTSDAGQVIISDIVTNNWDGGVTSRKKYLPKMYIIGDIVPGSTVEISTSDDDYQTWSNPQSADMGLSDPPSINCGGSFHRRAHRIRHQSDTKQRIKAIEFQVDLGTN